MSMRRSFLIAACVALLPTLASFAHGDPRRDRDEHPQRPMREAIGEVEQHYRGHVVNVQSLRSNDANASDEDMYRMRVLQRDGRVKTVTVPANKQRR